MAVARKTKIAEAIPTETITPIIETTPKSIEIKVEPPSFARTASAWILGLTASIGIGAIGGVIVQYALIGAATAGAAAWVSALIFALGATICCFFGEMASRRAYLWVINKHFDSLVEQAKELFTTLTTPSGVKNESN